MELKDLPAWVSAGAAVLSMIGLFLAFRQLRLSRHIAESQFEDQLAREYREIAGKLPKKALMGQALSAEEREASFDEFYRYFDLSNEQVFLRVQGRVRTSTWSNWSSGIRAMLQRTAFQEAWEEILGYPRHGFDELSRLVREEFANDPIGWTTLPAMEAQQSADVVKPETMTGPGAG